MRLIQMRVSTLLLEKWLQLPGDVRIERVAAGEHDGTFAVVLESPSFPEAGNGLPPLVEPVLHERYVRWDWQLPQPVTLTVSGSVGGPTP